MHNGYDDLPTRDNVARGDAGAYQSRTVGDTEYQISGGGANVWADGIDEASNMAQDAKYVGNEARSPYVQGSSAPDFLQTKIEDEFTRYSQVINDLNNPIEGLQVITNSENAVSYFRNMMNSHNIPGEVIVIK